MTQYIVAVIDTAERKCVELCFPNSEEDMLSLAADREKSFGNGHVILTHAGAKSIDEDAMPRMEDINYEAHMQVQMLRTTHPLLGAPWAGSNGGRR